MRAVLIAVVALAACTGRSPAQGAAAGEQVFKRLCSPCHEIGREAKVKLGPPLNGIESSTLKLPTYIHAPMQKVPGTKMAFVGMKNDKDIADLWAYLKQFGPDGQKK